MHEARALEPPAECSTWSTLDKWDMRVTYAGKREGLVVAALLEAVCIHDVQAA